MLRALGWRNEVFIVDDNFIGNSKNALQLALELAAWGETQRTSVLVLHRSLRSIWRTGPN